MSVEENSSHFREVQNLRQAIDKLEGQRAILGDQTVDIAQASIREKIARQERKEPASP